MKSSQSLHVFEDLGKYERDSRSFARDLSQKVTLACMCRRQIGPTSHVLGERKSPHSSRAVLQTSGTDPTKQNSLDSSPTCGKREAFIPPGAKHLKGTALFTSQSIHCCRLCQDLVKLSRCPSYWYHFLVGTSSLYLRVLVVWWLAITLNGVSPSVHRPIFGG